MQRAAQTYGAVAKQTANPRELEADLLLTAAARLQAIHDGWESRRPELDAALLVDALDELLLRHPSRSRSAVPARPREGAL